MAENWQDEVGPGEGLLVQRQGHAAPAPRPGRGGRGRPRRHDAGAGAVARRVRPGQALQGRHAAAPVGHGGGRRQDGARRRPDGGGPHQQVRRHQRPADRAARRRLRVQARRGPAQGGEARRRGQDRRPRGRLPLQRLPGLHAGVRGAQARQHDHACASTPRSRTTKCSRYTFRPFDYAPAQAVAAAPYLVNKMGKKWHIAYADYAWGQSTTRRLRRADQEGGRRGRRARPASRSAPPT